MMMKSPVPKGTKSKKVNKLIARGERTRTEILDVSIDLASAEGLDGLTIGRLAKDLKMSKSGLFAHFGSKEELQIAAINAARDVFIDEIITPAESAEPGLQRLVRLLFNWISYVERSVFRGGCFFFAVSAEMDDRPGPVRDLIAELTMAWVNLLKREIDNAVGSGQLFKEADTDLLVFQLHGFVQEANWFFRLHDDQAAFDRARRSIGDAVNALATSSGRKEVKEMIADD